MISYIFVKFYYKSVFKLEHGSTFISCSFLCKTSMRDARCYKGFRGPQVFAKYRSNQHKNNILSLKCDKISNSKH